MKRIAIVCIVAVTAIGAVSAQAFAGRPMAAPAMAATAEAVTIEGKLSLVQGRPAVVVKDKTYFVRIPQYLYGFIDGLKEGAQVKLEGYEAEIPFAPSSFFFAVEKLTIGGKSYDLSQVGGRAIGPMGGMGGSMGGFGGGRGGMDWDQGQGRGWRR